MPYLFRVRLDDLSAKFQASVCIDGIPDPSIKAVVHMAAFISDQHLYVEEDIFAHAELHERFVLKKMWFRVPGLFGVTKKGIEQYEPFIIGLVQVLHMSPLPLGFRLSRLLVDIQA